MTYEFDGIQSQVQMVASICSMSTSDLSFD